MALYGAGDETRYIREAQSASGARSNFRRDYARVIHCPSFRRLQGKTQLFPGHESDFFRNRLTHSLEVAQIAESIAMELNEKSKELKDSPIEPRICQVAALLHDIGHPPFGHNGEEALDEQMLQLGGFEGNAQTLRIVTQIEKKRHNPQETCLLARRAGLNLTYRVLAAILKYDRRIPMQRQDGSKVAKGYYFEDSPIVEDIKNSVVPGWGSSKGEFKTIECSIMDVADDIAYSTYDLEDSFKAGFLTPEKLLTSPQDLLEKVASQVSERTGIKEFNSSSVLEIFFDLFSGYIEEDTFRRLDKSELSRLEKIVNSMELTQQLQNISSAGEIRTAFTSSLVGEFINSITLDYNEKFPQLSKIKIDEKILLKIETLKVYTYEAIIVSNRVKLSEYRGKEVVKGIFEALMEKKGKMLLPDDVLALYEAARGDYQKQARVVADFIAGMTDRYALEFYGRLHSDSPQTIFKEA